MKILNHRQIKQKIRRLAIQIVEEHYGEPSIVLAGINNNGYHFAQLLEKELQALARVTPILTRIRLNPANPLDQEITVEHPLEELDGKVIIVVDDVANTGRTIFYACKPILAIVPKKLEVAVLVDRTHKSFPVKVDFVGLSLATTLNEHIEVHIRNIEEYEVLLT